MLLNKCNFFRFQKSAEGITDKEKDTLNNIKLISLLNMAAVKLKRDLFKEAVGICNKVSLCY